VGTWRVSSHPDGHWKVLRPGGTQACARTNRDHAVTTARALARIEGGGIVDVENARGDPESQHIVLWDELPEGTGT
jgi:hypothetical protein